MARNYINNKQLYEVMKQYIEDLEYTNSKHIDPPPIPNYIGECFLLIATNLASKSNFSGYSFKDEMISDGIENCIKYMHNFDPYKYNNPFAYFTQMIKFAFIRRIESEQKQQYIKVKNFQRQNLIDVINGEEISVQEYNDITNEFIERFENKLTKKKKAAKMKSNTVTQYFEEEKDNGTAK